MSIFEEFSEISKEYMECVDVMCMITKNHGIIRLLDEFLDGNGYGNDIYGFNFPNVYEPDESDDPNYFESGVQFYFHDTICVLSDVDFINLVEKFCYIYLKRNISEDEEKSVISILSNLRKKYQTK